MVSGNVRILNSNSDLPAILFEKRNEAPCSIAGKWSQVEFTLPPRDNGRLKHSDFMKNNNLKKHVVLKIMQRKLANSRDEMKI